MAFSSREMSLTIKFVDDASGAIDSITQRLSTVERTGGGLLATGIALQRIGDAMGNIGKAGLGFFNSAIDAAVEYSHQTALTATQAEGLGISFQQLKDIGRNVATSVGTDFSQIQPTLYDIFSSIKTDAPGAQKALEQFARASVAGNADIQDVARITMAEMNAFGLTTDDVSSLLDKQFAMVRYGVGTYQEFASSMGLSIPTARAAGQSIDTLSGGLAFLTRNGLSVSSATSSMGRAFELLYSPKGQAGLKKLGIDIYDSNGKVKQMNQIVTELAVNKGWAQLDEAQRRIVFKETFGQGTIQARRFFDVAIPNYASLNEITGLVAGSQGDLNDAYNLVSNEPAVKAELLRNKYLAMKQTIGDQLLPVKVKLMEVLSKLLDMWNKLSPKTQEIIIKVLAFGAAFLAVAGPIIGFIGSVLTVIGLLEFLDGSLVVAALIVGGVVVALAALAAVGYLIYKNWDKVKPVLIDVWNALKEAWSSFLDGLKGGDGQSGALGFMQDLGRYALDTWNGLKAFWDWLTNTAWPAMKQGWSDVKDAADTFWTKLTDIWNWLSATFGPGILQVWNSIKENLGPIIGEIGETVDALKERWDKMWPAIKGFGELIVAVFEYLKPYIEIALKFIWEIMQVTWNSIKDLIVDTWNFISRFLSDVFKVIGNIIQLFLNLFQGDWGAAWENVKAIFSGTWDAIIAIVRFVWELIKNLFSLGLAVVVAILRGAIRLFIQAGSDLMSGLWTTIQWWWDVIKGFFGGIGGVIKSLFSGASEWLKGVGEAIMQGLWNGINGKIKSIKDLLKSVTGLIPSWKGPADVDRKLLYSNGEMIMQGLAAGLDSGWGDVKSYLNGLTTSANFAPQIAVTGSSGNSQPDLEEMTRRIVEAIHTIQPTNIENLQVGDTKQVATLDFWGAVKNSGNS